jgi:hypothetical protein
MWRQLGWISATALFANAAMAQEIYLRCDFPNFRLSPVVFRFDLENRRAWSATSLSVTGYSPYRLFVSREAFSLPASDGTTYVFINRITGDATLMEKWRGMCQKIDRPVLQ